MQDAVWQPKAPEAHFCLKAVLRHGAAYDKNCWNQPFTHLLMGTATRGFSTLAELERAERLQIMLSATELVAVENFRFDKRMPSRAAAVRELLRRGLAAEGFLLADPDARSQDYGVVSSDPNKSGRRGKR